MTCQPRCFADSDCNEENCFQLRELRVAWLCSVLWPLFQWILSLETSESRSSGSLALIKEKVKLDSRLQFHASLLDLLRG